MSTHAATRTTDNRETCTQARCLLKQHELNSNRLAENLVSLLAGTAPESIAPGARIIVPRPACIRCAKRVINGRKAFYTDSEWQHLDDLGQWHRRRSQRRDRYTFA